MPAEPAPSAKYRGSHRQLLRSIPGVAPGAPSHRLDAIVVPTSRCLTRRLPGVELAVRLALQMDCALVVLCSGDARARDFPMALKQKMDDRLDVWQLSHRDRSALPMLSSSKNRLSRLYRSSDLGLKRNLGLALAANNRWSRLLFIDDDITAHDSGETLDQHRLKDALYAMHANVALRAVGWLVEEFPDNSVVGHTRRLVHEEQDTFVGGGALLVRCDARVPFFPEIFNEDWLFLIASAIASPDYRASIGYAGYVGQLTYDPFKIIRAQSEEAGDIIGEGLMNLLEDDGPGYLPQGTDPRYWRGAMQARRTLIRQIQAAVSSNQRLQPICSNVQEALSAARGVHSRIAPHEIAEYVNDWLHDLPNWQAYLAELASKPQEPAPAMNDTAPGTAI